MSSSQAASQAAVPVGRRHAAIAAAASTELRAVRTLTPTVVSHGEPDAAAGRAGRRVAGGRPATPSAYDPFEREPEVLAEQRIYHRVYGTVTVAQPEHEGEQCGLNAGGTERADQVHGEKRQPAHYKTADDDAQRLGRLGLHSEPFHLGLYISLATSHHLRGELWLLRRPGAAHATAHACVATAVANATAVRTIVRRRW